MPTGDGRPSGIRARGNDADPRGEFAWANVEGTFVTISFCALERSPTSLYFAFPTEVVVVAAFIARVPTVISVGVRFGGLSWGTSTSFPCLAEVDLQMKTCAFGNLLSYNGAYTVQSRMI